MVHCLKRMHPTDNLRAPLPWGGGGFDRDRAMEVKSFFMTHPALAGHPGPGGDLAETRADRRDPSMVHCFANAPYG